MQTPLHQSYLEVRTAGRENHFVSLGALAVAGDGHVGEGLFVPEVLEGGHHVRLKVVPAKAKLLLVIHVETWRDLKIYSKD